jgi:hypothetical protein
MKGEIKMDKVVKKMKVTNFKDPSKLLGGFFDAIWRL